MTSEESRRNFLSWLSDGPSICEFCGGSGDNAYDGRILCKEDSNILFAVNTRLDFFHRYNKMPELAVEDVPFAELDY